MYFDEMVCLEHNGLMTATWLVTLEDKTLALWPDVDGNRDWDFSDTADTEDWEPFLVRIGDQKDLAEFVSHLSLAMVCRVYVTWRDLVIEPSEDGSTAVRIYPKGAGAIAKDGDTFLGLKYGADQGQFATIWYEKSLMGLHIAGQYGIDAAEEWELVHDSYVPGSRWPHGDQYLYTFGEKLSIERRPRCSWCGAGLAIPGGELCPTCLSKAEP